MSQIRSQPSNSVKFIIRLAGLSLVLVALALTGCSMMRLSKSHPEARVDSLQLTGKTTGPVTFTVLQAQLMRFADTYVANVAQACDDVSAQATNSEVRLMALRWKLGQATAIFTDATGQNPVVNALDMLVRVTLSRMVIQDYGVGTYGDAMLPLLDTQRRLETNAWTLAASTLKPSQQQELRDLIQEWRAKNPDQRYVGPIRFREFVAGLGKTPTQANTSPSSIFSLLYLDPLAGLDPTAAAIQETRELGERAMFYSQRMPMLLSWQVEVLAYQIADQPESKQILNDASRLATSAEVFAQTARQLPQLVNDQRQAAIQQVFDGLNAGSNKSRELLTDTRSTLDSASAAATNLNTAIQSLTDFVRLVSPTNARPAAANKKPFNVLDYGTAASQIAGAARDLNATLLTINQSAPELARLSRQSAADAKQIVDHAFRCGVAWVLILLAGSVLAGLVYRVLANKITKAGRPPTQV